MYYVSLMLSLSMFLILESTNRWMKTQLHGKFETIAQRLKLVSPLSASCWEMIVNEWSEKRMENCRRRMKCEECLDVSCIEPVF